MEIARTILEQLGGNQFAMMTGAKNFIAAEKGLSFKVGRNSKSVSHVRITLDPDDTYSVEFIRVRAGKLTQVAKETGVYCDMLQNIFTEHTGLYTSLGSLGRTREAV